MPDEKSQLLAEIAAARVRLDHAGGELRAAGEGVKRSLDIPARVAGSFTKHRPAWLGGAAVLGFLLSKLPARKKVVYVERSTGEELGVAGRFGWGALKMLGSLAKPLLSELAGARLAEMAARFSKKAPENDEGRKSNDE